MYVCVSDIGFADFAADIDPSDAIVSTGEKYFHCGPRQLEQDPNLSLVGFYLDL
jgi:hypothetical protein